MEVPHCLAGLSNNQKTQKNFIHDADLSEHNVEYFLWKLKDRADQLDLSLYEEFLKAIKHPKHDIIINSVIECFRQNPVDCLLCCLKTVEFFPLAGWAWKYLYRKSTQLHYSIGLDMVKVCIASRNLKGLKWMAEDLGLQLTCGSEPILSILMDCIMLDNTEMVETVFSLARSLMSKEWLGLFPKGPALFNLWLDEIILKHRHFSRLQCKNVVCRLMFETMQERKQRTTFRPLEEHILCEMDLLYKRLDSIASE